ncbi:hypothetical protein CEP52_016022 [Fusarium oligoseptatum]|uniref:HPP transmembrane region domain-containing protein n=1 Tax=Fusarium oligoseptatum TaxID=2604345 RepID=A0A428S8F1_9HYPO|nr:hypothetical protein CEP52_016022 [Fusarium oligoseptatum]
MSRWDPTTWKFDIDRLLNRFVPPPPWRHLPYPVAYFLGYRHKKPRDIGTVVPVLWAFVGIFLVRVLFSSFYAIESPLAQPRNFFFGQLIAAILGIGIGKLFLLSDDFESIRWVGGAISCATVTAVMALTKTIHPPAGATALLAVVDDRLLALGWFFIPVVLFNCTIMFAVALLINNIQRTYPSYWWTPEDLRGVRTEGERQRPPSDIESKGGVAEEMRTEDGSDTERHERHDGQEIIIKPGGVLVLPSHIFLMQEEIQLLEEISNRL